MDISTVLICSVCGKTLFKEKKHEGTILLHCTNCGSSAKVGKAGIGFAEVSRLQESGKIFPTVKEVKVAKGKDGDEEGQEKVFQVIEFRLPAAVKSLVQAALLCAREAMGVTGSLYAGTALGNIMSDYLSGFDYALLPPDVLEKVTTLLQSVSDGVQDGTSEEFKSMPGNAGEHVEAAVKKVLEGPFKGLPELAEKVRTEVKEKKVEAKKDHAQKVGAIRRQKSLSRLETCVRALDSQIQQVRGSDDALEAAELDGLYASLEAGTEHLTRVRAGTSSLSDTAVQRFMRGVEKKLGLSAPTKRKGSDDEDDGAFDE
jgi:uncharacterized Zn finger protein (UPF0148 family)